MKIITAQPNDLYFLWQLRVQLNNLRKYGLSSDYTALVWYHTDRQGGKDFANEWNKLKTDYPEANIVFYTDPTGHLMRMIRSANYIPLLRPWLLAKYFSDVPELEKEAVLYMDSDVIFTKQPDFSRLLNDDICYLSNTKSYIAASYFDSKIKDVLPDKVELYKEVDVLNTLMKVFGLNRKVAEENEEGSGGAQYILKGANQDFWFDVFSGCILVRNYLSGVNRQFFANEDKGFQSWCADMWSILFNLWKRGIKTDCPPEMDFCWATDPIEKWGKVQIYHDAGAHTREIKPGHQLFMKREAPYINNERTPFDDDLSFVSDEYCSKNYAKEITEVAAELWATQELKNPDIQKQMDEQFKDFIIKG